MSYQVSASRKRPQTFDELAGQDFVATTLKASIKSGRIAQAYLFSGPRGCGKTSTARILAKSLNCEQGPTDKPCGKCNSCVAVSSGASLDVIEIDGASHTSVENIRQIKDEVLFPPTSSKYKIYIIDEVHMLSNSAFNALLKTIEEPPPYIIFIFATTELHKVPATIKSRCQQFNFRLFSIDTIKPLLASLAAELGVTAEDEALLWIAKESTGSMRDAYTIFDQVLSFSNGHISADTIKNKLGLVSHERIASILSLCVAAKRNEALSALTDIFDSGIAVEQFISDAILYTRSLLFVKSGITKEGILGLPMSAFPQELLSALDEPKLEQIIAVFFNLYRDIRYSINPRWEIELAISRLCFIKDYVSKHDLQAAIKTIKQTISQQSIVLEKSDVHAINVNAAEPVAEPEINTTKSDSNDLKTNDLKANILAAIGKENVVLYSCVEHSGVWHIDDTQLTIECFSNYDAGAILSESQLIAKAVFAATGLNIKVNTKVSNQTNAVPEKTSNDAAKMVAQVFSGQIIEKNFSDDS